MLTGPSLALSLSGVIYMLYIFSVLSRKLGSVTKMRPLYRGFYVAIGLIGLAVMSSWLLLTVRFTPDLLPATWHGETLFLAIFAAPMVTAVTLSLGVAWRYWGWLFKERGR
ncbi:MAG: hypothetical protein HY870_19815 [Chloroflexi bacterium]|nr:hypothetical protein [Chloroflexota bacterium]